MTVLELSGSPRERGLAHGEQCAEQIREYAAERLAWSAVASGTG